MSTSITIVLVDDHTLIREGLARSLGAESDIAVLANVGTADAAREACLTHRPQVLLSEIAIPGMLALAADVSTKMTATHVVFLSAVWHDRYIEQALAIEASGYIAKTEHLSAVIVAIRAVVGGATYYSPQVRSRIVSTNGEASTARSRRSTLTARELEILRYLARGLSKKQIAGLTERSVHTVDKHVRNLMRKLDIHDRVELSRFAIREGLAEA